MTRSRIGVLGGTFDPIHVGHLAAAEDAAWQLSLDLVLFVPNNVPPHKQDRAVSATAHRVAMVEAAVRDNLLFAVSRIEVDRDGPSYTLDTMRQLRSQLGDAVGIIFLAGRDALTDLHTWNQPDQLLEEFELAFLCRPGADPVEWEWIEARFPDLRARVQILDVPELEISSSDIRTRVRQSRPIRYYVTAPVHEYIEAHSLYRD